MKKVHILLLLLGVVLLFSTTLLMATPTVMTIPRQVVASGGTDSSNETFVVSGTIGQSITAVSYNRTFSLSSGYWSGTTANYDIYLPTILK